MAGQSPELVGKPLRLVTFGCYVPAAQSTRLSDREGDEDCHVGIAARNHCAEKRFVVACKTKQLDAGRRMSTFLPVSY